MLVVPEAITIEIAKFATTLSVGSFPVVVPVSPAHGAVHLSCWQNVQQVCSTEGGQPVKGWRIWWIPQILIEAQAHVVWRSPADDLTDVTPNEDDEQICVFLSDPSMPEQPGKDFVASRHENLCGESFVDEYIRCAIAVARHEDTVRTTGLWLPDPPEAAIQRQELQRIAEFQQRLREAGN
jgi:hypothetical protein